MIEELLALWQETRSDEVASLLAQTSADRPPITGSSQRALHAAWLGVAAAADPLDIERLLATLTNGNLTQTTERLRHLATRPPDPRIAASLEALIANPPSAPFVKGTSIGMWNLVFALLTSIADPRTRTIHERIAWLAHDRATSPFDIGTLRSRTITGIANAAHAIPPAPALTAAQQARIAELVTRAPPKPIAHGPELLARIYDHPRDLDARSIYADWLTSQGDPRGEFIALQLARPLPTTRPWQWHRRHVSTREARLLRTHEKSWIGRLGAFLEHVRFERGFPAYASLATEIDVATIALPEAATLDHLSVHRDDFATGRRLAAPPFHGLTSISGIGWQTLAGLLAQPGTTIRAVEVPDGELPTALDFLDRDVTLDLLDLELGHMTSTPPPTAHVHAFLRAPVIGRLRTLCVGTNVGNEDAFIEAFVRSSIGTLELRDHRGNLSIERHADGFRVVRHNTHPRADQAIATLRGVASVVE